MVWIWLLISAAWFAINVHFIPQHDGSLWFVALLPFGIGLLFFVGAGLAAGLSKEPRGRSQY